MTTQETFQYILQETNATPAGDGYLGHCPVHEDKERSLSASIKEGKIGLYCHAGCETKDVVEALNLEMKNLFPSQADNKSKGKIVATYDYVDRDGKLCYQAVRKEPKSFLQRRPDPKNPKKWIWKMAGIKPLPYRLPEVLEAIRQGNFIFIVEGEKDVENIRALGLTATCNHGGAGKWKLAHTKHFKEGAKVVILPDNDEPGMKHAHQVAQQLHASGCEVKVLRLPDLPEKGDVSDWIKSGGTRDKLLELVDKTELWQPPSAEAKTKLPAIYRGWIGALEDTSCYRVDAWGNLNYVQFMDTGEIWHRIANFIARPTKEVVIDNGLESEMTFHITGIKAGGRPLPEVSVQAEKFHNLAWVTGSWGLGCNIEPGVKNRDRTRHAIQSLAGDIEREIIFSHTGWREINEKWVYLHSGGAVGGDSGISVDLSRDALTRYKLPDDAGDLQKSVSAALQLLAVAPLRTTVPLLAMVYLAPMCEMLRQAGLEPGFVLWLVGMTGAMKSTLAALFLSHFGDFTNKTLPASFKDTANTLEKRAFLTKDSLLVIDDYHPTSSPSEAAAMNVSAQRILRGYGDRTGRGRMRSDMTLRPDYIPQGMAIVTGEDFPDVGQSGAARYLSVELQQGDIDKELLTKLQGRTEDLGYAMKGYIRWFSEDMQNNENRKHFYRAEFNDLRQAALGEHHSRLPEVVAWLYLGFSSFLDFSLAAGVGTDKEAEKIKADAFKILMDLAAEHGKFINSDKPGKKFINYLSELITSGVVYTRQLSLEGHTPNDEKAQFVGWHDENFLYLLPDKTFETVYKFASGQGARFPVSANTLWKHLDAAGYIVSRKEGKVGRRVVNKKINGKKYRIIQLLKSSLQFDD